LRHKWRERVVDAGFGYVDATMLDLTPFLL
jgi:hypothetical protein